MSPADTTLMGDLSGLSYITGVSYDDLGQVTSTEMPAVGGLPNEKSVVGYRLSGQAQTLKLQGVGADVGTSTTLVSAVAMDGTGLFASRTYGNDVTRGVSYDPVTRQVSGLSASFSSGTAEVPKTTFVQADSFTRDGLGRLTQIASAVPNGGEGATSGEVTGQCFTYDGFNRLKWAWTVAGTDSVGACGTTDPTGVVGSDASATTYATAWSYSKSGQISDIVNRVVTDGVAAPVTAHLTCGGSSAPASGVASMTGGATNGTYTYDGAGRQITRTVGGVATTLSWDVSSNLVETSGAGGHLLYVYDASGQRVAKIRVADNAHGVIGAVTGYLGSTELTDANTAVNHTSDSELVEAGFITGTRYYAFGGATVAVRQVTAPVAPAPATSTLSLMFGDEQGSATVMMQVALVGSGAMAPASVTDPITRNAYTPYGAVRGADNLSIDHGWLNQVSDDASTGLVYLNARYYDTGTSRFVSPDPLMNPTDPRTLDAFRYANNNPVAYTDASGLGPNCPSYLTGAALSNCNAYANSPVNYFTGAKTTGQPKPGTTFVVKAPSGGQCPSWDSKCVQAHAASLGITDINSQNYYNGAPPPPDDGSVYYNGNWCLPGSACYADSLNYHHNPAMDKALIDALFMDDFNGCRGDGSGWLGTVGHCFSLGMTVFPGVGEIGGGLKGGKILTFAVKGGEDAVKAKRAAEVTDAAWDIAMKAFDKHGADLGFKSVDDMAVYVDRVMASGPGAVRDSDKALLWADDANRVVVIRGGSQADVGSVYRPANWVDYMNKLDAETSMG